MKKKKYSDMTEEEKKEVLDYRRKIDEENFKYETEKKEKEVLDQYRKEQEEDFHQYLKREGFSQTEIEELDRQKYKLDKIREKEERLQNKQILKTGFTINSLPDRMTKGFVVFSVLLTIITIFTRFSGSDIYLPDQWSLDTPHPIYGNETHIRVQFYSYWGLKKDNHRLHWDEVERWWYYNQKTTDLIDGVDSTYISQIQYYKIQ